MRILGALLKVRERSRISNHTDVSAACWLLPDALSSRHKCKSISDRTSDFLNKEETEPQKKIESCKPGFKEHGDMRGYGYHGKMGKMENMLSLVMLKCNYSLKEIAFPSETLYVIYLEG